MTTHKSSHARARHARARALAVCTPLAVVLLYSLPAMAKPEPKVEICHIPPGNPANAHTISVSGNAIKAHLKHGDYLGACQLQCEDACDDGNACTIDECIAGECDHSPVSCNDGNQCTADSCNSETGGCDNFALPGQPCTDQDGSACTLDTGLCNAAADCELTAIPDCCESDADCADEDLCTFEVCTNNACVSDGTAFCAPNDACEQTGCDPATGQCVDVPVVCDPPGPCETGGYCDPTAGCVYAPIPGCCLGDSACNDDDPCTADTCVDFACEHEVCHAPVSACDEYETCDDNCVPIITGWTDCSDGSLCTDDECDPVDGCLNPPTSCGDGDVCTDDLCAPETGCSNPETDCSDEDFCTVGEFCDPALGCASSPRDCDDGDPCTIDSCSSELAVCVNAPKCDEAAGESCNPTTGTCETEVVCDFSADASSVDLYFATGYAPLPSNPFPLEFNGTARVICGTEVIDGTNAQRPCRGEFLDTIWVFIPVIGDVCLIPMPAEECATGVVDCDPGTDRDIVLEMNHNIPVPGGTCDSQPECQTACDAHCASLGPGFTRFPNSVACEGFCRLTDPPISMCTTDEAPVPDEFSCPDGDTCDEFQHEACGCQCQQIGNGTPVGRGHANLEIGYGININFINPATGEVFEGTRGPDSQPCTDDDQPQGTLPPTCFPFTTTATSDFIRNPNNVPGAAPISTAARTGAPFQCSNDGELLSAIGARLEGIGQNLDTRLFDFSSSLTITCE